MINLLESFDISGSTAIIPTLSVANIPQLTVDLIIHNTSCKKIADIWHEAFIPYVGPDPFKEDSSTLCSTVEVYFCEEKKIIVLQMRSPTLGYSKTAAFIEDLCAWLKAEKVKNIVVLTSIYSYLRYDDEIQDRSDYADFRHIPISNEDANSFDYSCNPNCALFLSDSRRQNCTGNDSLGIKKLGTGFASELYKKCIEVGLPAVIILKFGSDGYNVPDAEMFLKLLNGWLKFMPGLASIRFPFSWEILQDTDPPLDLYMG